MARKALMHMASGFRKDDFKGTLWGGAKMAEE